MGSPFYRMNPPGDNVIVKLFGQEAEENIGWITQTTNMM
ncbi:hypothetical protein BIW11_05019 [Tropilaelaps mercedesae]|uniref:Uncharacterized protein n=1 Tax=Tropilaelaps mercedesae TaxID=418985 RepID=A0A1V9WYD7_9ACAR|nr:hypothetical protein BIW11_05019 [Tropilaelaps mercedesae]